VSPHGDADLTPAQGKGKLAPTPRGVRVLPCTRANNPNTINIIIFIIIEGINFKNTIIYVININISIIFQSINIKNIIICGINIIISGTNVFI
jgi:hypothetical protein